MSPSRGAIFRKNSYFIVIESHCLEPFETIRFLTFESQLKIIELFHPAFIHDLIQNMFKVLYFGVEFCK